MKQDKLEILYNKVLDIFHINFNDKTRKLIFQIFKFGVVGGISFVMDYVILIICREVFDIEILTSTAIAFVLSLIVNYILSVKWVYDVDETKDKKKNFITFVLFSLFGISITEVIMWIGTSIMGISYLIVKIIATSIVMVFNFITRKIFLE